MHGRSLVGPRMLSHRTEDGDGIDVAGSTFLVRERATTVL